MKKGNQIAVNIEVLSTKSPLIRMSKTQHYYTQLTGLAARLTASRWVITLEMFVLGCILLPNYRATKQQYAYNNDLMLMLKAKQLRLLASRDKVALQGRCIKMGRALTGCDCEAK